MIVDDWLFSRMIKMIVDLISEIDLDLKTEMTLSKFPMIHATVSPIHRRLLFGHGCPSLQVLGISSTTPLTTTLCVEQVLWCSFPPSFFSFLAWKYARWGTVIRAVDVVVGYDHVHQFCIWRYILRKPVPAYFLCLCMCICQRATVRRSSPFWPRQLPEGICCRVGTI